MHSEQLEQQLAAYAGFLDEVSRERLPDLTPNKEIEGDVTVVDLMTRQDEAEGTGSGRLGRPFGGSATWMVAVAAALALIAALAFLLPGGEDGSLETIEPPEVEAEPELIDQPEPVEADESAVDAPAIQDVGGRLESATEQESAELLADLYASDVNLTLDGVEFDTGSGYDFVTDPRVAELIDLRFTDCSPGDGGLSCSWAMDFTFLGDAATAQEGTAELMVSDGRITRLEMETSDLDEVVAGLALYRGWVENSAEDVEALFTPQGTPLIDGTLVDRHAAAGSDLVAALDGATNPDGVGDLFNAVWSSGESDAAERVFANTTVLGLGGPPIESRAMAQNILTGPLYFEVLAPVAQDCEVAETDDVVRCSFTSSSRLVPAIRGDFGHIEFTYVSGLLNGIIFLGEGGEAVSADTAAYESWVGDTHPDDYATMFSAPLQFALTEESIALHRQYGAEWSATLEG